MTATEANRGEGQGPAKKRVFLVDGHSYLYRAFHATPFLSNSKGIPTNATYAFLSMIRKLTAEQAPDTLIVVFDSGEPSFREEISRAYKAQRPPMPGNLIVQIPYVKAIVEALGIPVLEREGFEADDIIATVVEMMKGRDVEIQIVTGDKDMMQLVSKDVFVFDTMKNARSGVTEVVEKLGVGPAYVVDFLALAGDSSDNIPGVPGVGGKTAKELIGRFGHIEDLYGRLDEVARVSLRTKLAEGRDLAFMSRELATLKRDVPLGREPESLVQGEEDRATLRRIFRELEFTSLYRAMRLEGTDERALVRVELSGLDPAKIALACRLQGKNPYDGTVESFAASDGERVFFSRSEEELIHLLIQGGELTCHNLKPLLTLLGKKGLRRDAPSFDTMLAAYLVNPMRKDFGAPAVIEEYLDAQAPGGGTEETLLWAAARLPELKETLRAEMHSRGLADLFSRVEMPLVEVLALMELQGVRIDRTILMELSRDFDGRLNRIMKEIHALAGGPFNINSPQQLSRVLFETLGLPPQKKTKTGFSTDTEVLEILAAFHPLPGQVLEYRSLTKLKGTYVDVLPTLIHPTTGRIHASFNQMVVATGRLSSSDPNLQNIPVRGEEGMKIRGAFIPADGFTLLSSDYSQIELRVLAHISGDPLLVETFLKGEDIHARVAQEVFGVGPEGVTPDMRRTAKVINFGIVYGMSGFGLARELNVSQREAQQYINDYFARHQGVKAYMDGVLREAREKGYVTTLLGRIRYIPEVQNHDPAVRQLGERAAMNSPIQGTAADIIKMAMVNIHRKIREKGLSSRLIMQIHDELVFEVRQGEEEAMEALVRAEMEGAISLCVPLRVSMGRGSNWAEAHG